MDLSPLKAALFASRSRTVQVVSHDTHALNLLARDLHEDVSGAAVVSHDPYAHISLLRDTVIEEVAIALEQRGAPRPQMQARCEAILERTGLSEFAERHPAQLSGGQTRRLAIATVAVLEPEILVLNDPFAGLDPASAALVIGLVRGLGSQVVALGTRPRPELGTSMLSLIDDHLSPVIPEAEPVALPAPVEPSADSLLEIGPVTVTRGGGEKKWWQFRKKAEVPFTVGPVSLAVPRGAATWLRGANGSGKTTLLRGMAGLDGNQPVADSVSLALQNSADQVVDTTVASFIGDGDLVARLGFDPEEHPLDLSARDLRLAQLASVLAQSRDLVLLDEPDVGLDTEGCTRAHELIAQMLSTGSAVILTCHDETFVDEVRGYAQVGELRL